MRKVGDHATNTVSAMRYGRMKGNKYVIDEGLKYAYDECGNISEVWENGELSGQVVRGTLTGEKSAK